MSNPPNAKPPQTGGGPTDTNGGANLLWGGRFAAGPSAIMQKINASIGFDSKLWREDIEGSKAHAAMLAYAGIITTEDAKAIRVGLDTVAAEIEEGAFDFKIEHEDIHLNIEARLAELIGPAAGRLHTARSRNDQVATDFKLWIRRALSRMEGDIRALQMALIEQAERHVTTIMPGFTHLQLAQPVTLAHHLLAYVEMLGRDRGRADDARRRAEECPLGAAALAGSPYPIDRAMTAKALGFARPARNSIDAVSDRDFALDYLATASILAVHLSRFAEELVLWSSDQFGFIRLSDAYTTGSSIMPQKRNPDAAELVRAKTGRVIGHLNSLLIALKGLPLAYSKDMQEDKEPVFETEETLALALAAMTGMVTDMKVDEAAMRRAADRGFVTATDLADWLVMKLGMPFREAHHVSGRLVKLAEARGAQLADLSLDEFRSVEPRIDEEIRAVLTVEASVASRQSEGGTSPLRVKEAIANAKERFL
ncbi:MAG TPA: argininosuccinate lyase [Alphaproteobacteria bacterium]|nr:argininosuccinate lyase [Alphaproteobacteria bacterium]